MNWKIQLLGRRDPVLAALAATETVPLHARVFLAAQIEAMPETAAGLSMIAHCQTVRGLANLHITIQPRAIA